MNKISKVQLSFLVVAMAAVLTVSGCSESPNQANSDAAAPPAPTPQATTPGMTAALTPEQAGAQYHLQTEPTLAQDGQVIRAVVSITNSGKVAVNSRGTLPVNLGVSVIDASGAMVTRDFVRASLPLDGIPVGGSADVVAEVPSKDVIGKGLRFGMVQEGVAWYSDLNVPALDYGVLTACEDQGRQTICGKDGKPLATAAAQ
ncbi:glycosyltransferase [uncultured Stenotrophomonas sp.]|uniref:glycosyltransferase n=1 Tax=uncultured Stenotrophomonas sp. TaxID=165438 RepID=UPI0028F1345A|nr:glycosyltransferase [uncultured Stenotrophomonas sp.]